MGRQCARATAILRLTQVALSLSGNLASVNFIVGLRRSLQEGLPGVENGEIVQLHLPTAKAWDFLYDDTKKRRRGKKEKREKGETGQKEIENTPNHLRRL